MGNEIQDGYIVFYQLEKGKPANIPAGGSAATDQATLKN